ncbi:MAG: hypothetical protein AVDCRST_MAG79-2718, partial [uncultured Thermoleophilia bacterium]
MARSATSTPARPRSGASVRSRELPLEGRVLLLVTLA